MTTHRDDDLRLMKIAQDISDGVPVNWDAESTLRKDLIGRLEKLKKMEALAEAHREPCASPGDVLPARWGHLQIVERIGRGRFGEVFRAIDPNLQRQVALKLRHAGRGDGAGRDPEVLLEEARRLARVRHPNVLAVHGADRIDDRVGLWTDLIEGTTLEESLSSRGPFGPREAALIGIDLCRALAAVHGAGLAHLDVKPANVMREQGGRIVLTDFSAVAEVAGAADAPGGRVSGTPLAMPPEVLLRGSPPGPAADIYAMGVLLYRLVSARYPIEASSFEELVEAHRAGAASPLRDRRPDLPSPFLEVVERAISADPARRYQSAGHLERALLASIETDAAPDPGPARRAGRIPRRALGWAALALLLAAGGILVATRGAAPGAVLTVEASLFREGAVSQERLGSGGRVFPGDRLFLELQGSVPLHVYVLDEDRRGDTFVLFPLSPQFQPANPLPAGVRHHLPGEIDGVPQYWEVTSPGGRERILVVASRGPVEEMDRLLAGIPRAAAGRPIAHGPVDLTTLEGVLRGVGGVGASPSSPGHPPSTIERISRLLARREGATGGIWMKEFDLENPGP